MVEYYYGSKEPILSNIWLNHCLLTSRKFKDSEKFQPMEACAHCAGCRWNLKCSFWRIWRYRLHKKHCGKRWNSSLILSNFTFSYKVFPKLFLKMCQNEYIWRKGLSLLYTEHSPNAFDNIVAKQEVALLFNHI